MKRLTAWLFATVLLLAWSMSAQAAQPILVVGHKNPDTDAIISAIAVAHLKTQMGIPATAIAQGLPNAETRYVLERFQISSPQVQTSVAGRQVILVDHSDYPQAPDDLKQADVIGLVDHHKLGGLTTDKPMEAWVFPVGCSGTIITRMYEQAGVAIPKPIAAGMLSAILSDTVIFKSPTTTPEDKAAAAKLAKIADIQDLQALGVKLFEAKATFKDVPAMNLLKQDFKTFNMNGQKVGVAQLEMMDLGTIAPMKADLRKAMAELKGEGYHSILLMLTDILKEGTEMLVVSDEAARIEGALNFALRDGAAWMPGVVSRKKQVIPGLEKSFK